MLIEAVKEPVTYRWPSGEIRLEPGRPVYLPESRALKLLAKAPENVRMVQSRALAFQLGDMIHWQTWDGKTHGPALVEHVTFSEGRTWAFVRYDGIDRWVSEVIITAVEPGDVSDD